MQEQLLKIFESQYKDKSLFDHFCELYYQMQENKYYNAQNLQDFEDLSNFIKEQRFYYTPLKSAEQVNNLKDQLYPWEEFREKQMQLLKQQHQSINTIIPYFPRLNQLLNETGYGFTPEEAQNIQQCLKQLASQGNMLSIRFWGKILTTTSDYYVIEAQLDKVYKESQSIDSDERLNEYVHYVTQDLLDEWCLLPIVNRNQMETSRQITYVFTGDLNSEIKLYPQFQGKEKHLLKAQILRITHANLISPRGLYKVNDEDPKIIQFEEEFKMPEWSELITMDGWVHQPANILKMGRITHYVDPNLNENDKQQILEQLVNDDPEIERLRSIKDDKVFEQNEGNWLIKIFGETQIFTSQDEGVLQYSIVFLRNYLWPGSITVSNINENISIYIGYGQKNQQQQFNPICPKDILEEPEDNEEYPEPNPQTQADELEPDSDDERRREQERKELLEQQQNE